MGFIELVKIGRKIFLRKPNVVALFKQIQQHVG